MSFFHENDTGDYAVPDIIHLSSTPKATVKNQRLENNSMRLLVTLGLLAVVLMPVSGLNQPERVTNRPIIATDVLPLQSSRVHNSHLAETILLGVEHSGDVGQSLAAAELAVAFDVASHAVDDVGHGLAGVGSVCIIVQHGGGVDGAVGTEGE